MVFSRFFSKSIYAVIVLMAVVSFVLPSYSQGSPESQSSVNSTDMSVILYGGIGYGISEYGVSTGDDITLVTGVGSDEAYGFELGTLFNYSFIGASLNVTGVQLNDLKSDISTEYGDGYYLLVDATLGLKLFTEAEDMGYTYIFGGLKYWQLSRDVEREGTLPDSDYKAELSGKGWEFGFRDFSTFPVSSFSIVLQTGMSFYSAPVDSIKSEGSKASFTTSDTAGAALELGLGVAFENIGLSVVASFKHDENATVYKIDGATESKVLGTGYNQFFLTLTKDFSI